MPNDDKPPARDDDPGAPPIAGRALAVFFLILATALVLGYLLLNKLIDISREEDCILAHRKDCAASMIPFLVGKLRSSDERWTDCPSHARYLPKANNPTATCAKSRYLAGSI